ncbi:hypothetical protein [Arthrobacter sp. YAF17]|uniref:hypothetical protein n=1 Tax=Arthrobacter sp. YAF17 TaxID=3233077 RepID=UPI003F925EE9
MSYTALSSTSRSPSRQGDNFAYAGSSNTEHTTAGANTSFIRDPDGTLISMRTSAGGSIYYPTDALGSTIASH